MSRLSHIQLHAVRRLLRASVRHTEIAKRLNLAVGTISRIASDRRLRRQKLELLGELDLPEDDAPPEYVASNLRRCPACGGMVYQWPCLVCRMRGHAGEIAADPHDDEGERGRVGEGETPSWARVSRPRPLPDLRSPVSARSETCAEHWEGEAPAEPPAGPTGRPMPAQAVGVGHEGDECPEPERGNTTIRIDPPHHVSPLQGFHRVLSPQTQGCALG
jgi:hypothetical protein